MKKTVIVIGIATFCTVAGSCGVSELNQDLAGINVETDSGVVPYDGGSVNIINALKDFPETVQFKDDEADSTAKTLGVTMSDFPIGGVGYNLDANPIKQIVIIMHGLHKVYTGADRSFLGYDYLARYLAEQGMTVISIDGEYLNGDVPDNNIVRGFLILNHLNRLLNDRAAQIDKNDLANLKIALVGHSRGGEGANAAWMLKKYLLDYFQGRGFLTSDSGGINLKNVKISSIVGIAPVAGAIREKEFINGSGVSGTDFLFSEDKLYFDNVDYFTLQGSHDGDTSEFLGMRTYDNAFKTENFITASGEKAALFIYGGNHSYFNSNWSKHWNALENIQKFGINERRVKGYNVRDRDGIAVPGDGYIAGWASSKEYSAIVQQEIAKKYIGAFLKWSFYKNDSASRKILAGDLYARPVYSSNDTYPNLAVDCNKVVTWHQYQPAERMFINNYEEDDKKETSSIPKDSNSFYATNAISPATLLFSLSEGKLRNDWQESGAMEPGESEVATLQWNLNQNKKFKYTIDLNPVPKSLKGNYNAIAFRAGQSVNSSLNQYGKKKTIHIAVNGFRSTRDIVLKDPMKATRYDLLPVGASKTMMETFNIPLSSVNSGPVTSNGVEKIEFILDDPSNSGRIILDDVQFTNALE